jgi:uncharacterized damage-inducible protein DinB
MIRSIADFNGLWKMESGMMQKVMDALTDTSLAQSINNDHRTLGRLAWHITQTTPEMLGKAGLKIAGPGDHDAMPASAKTIAKAYADSASAIEGAIAAAKWTDKTLDEKREMYGEQWTVGFTLQCFVFHQTHHRGQMTVLMRQAGVPVPSLYGPVKEDWAQWGMQPPAI